MMSDSAIERALRSLDGLSVGDAFGQMFFGDPGEIWKRIENRELPPATWEWTDDTAMARVVARALQRDGTLEPDGLSKMFAEEYLREPGRGYGMGAAQVLNEIRYGVSWRGAAGKLFGGTGSKGNGAAMRAAPVGAYFCDVPERVVRQAVDCSRVTHTHPDGVAGGVAVALAAAWFCRNEAADGSLFDFVLEHTPPGHLRRGIRAAADLGPGENVLRAAEILGNGDQILAQDTVPFCLWCAAHHGDEFEKAMWVTVSALGDRDTTCAIVGGIIGSKAPPPVDWMARREPL